MAITAIVVYAPYSNEMRNALMNFSLNKFIFSIFTLQNSYLLGSKILKSYRLALFAHCKHERLYSQCTTLVDDGTLIGFGNLSDHWTEQSDNLCEYFSEQS